MLHVLLHTYLSRRGENRLTWLVRLFYNLQKFAHKQSMFYCLTKWQLAKSFKFLRFTTPQVATRLYKQSSGTSNDIANH